jgi:hypothetical protein
VEICRVSASRSFAIERADEKPFTDEKHKSFFRDTCEIIKLSSNALVGKFIADSEASEINMCSAIIVFIRLDCRAVAVVLIDVDFHLAASLWSVTIIKWEMLVKSAIEKKFEGVKANKTSPHRLIGII